MVTSAAWLGGADGAPALGASGQGPWRLQRGHWRVLLCQSWLWGCSREREAAMGCSSQAPAVSDRVHASLAACTRALPPPVPLCSLPSLFYLNWL